LDQGDDVQRVVELPVAGARQPVPSALSAGDLDWSRSGVAGEVRRRGEARRPSGAAKQPPGNDRADANGLGQSAAQRGDRVLDLFADHGQPAIQSADLSDQIPGDLLAGAVSCGQRVDRAEQRGRLVGAELAWGATRDKLAQQRMELVDAAGALADQVAAPFLQHRQHNRRVLWLQLLGVALQRRDPSRGGRVQRIGLTATPARQLADPCGGGGAHVLDGLPTSQQPLSEMAAQPAGVLDRPTPLRKLPGPCQQLPIPGLAGRHLQAGQLLVGPDDQGGGRVGLLVGVNAEYDQGHGCLLLLTGRDAVADSPTCRRHAHASVESGHDRAPAGGMPTVSQPDGGRMSPSHPVDAPGHAT